MKEGRSVAGPIGADDASGIVCIACGKPCPGKRCDSCGASREVRDYQLDAVLGKGASGCVYRARKPGGPWLALKELWFAQVPDASALDAFEREMELLAKLQHPGIPRLVESFRDGEDIHLRLYLAQELIEGRPLGSDGKRLNEPAAIAIADQVVAILQYLQDRVPPITHRDLKPANLIEKPDGSLALVDFGSARMLPNGQTHSATLVGTYGYMPLEQLGGTVDETTDLYALGATLIQLLSGIEPWHLFDPELGLQFEERVHVSDPMLAFLERLVARRRQRRYPNAAAARLALDQIKATRQPQPQPARPHESVGARHTEAHRPQVPESAVQKAGHLPLARTQVPASALVSRTSGPPLSARAERYTRRLEAKADRALRRVLKDAEDDVDSVFEKFEQETAEQKPHRRVPYVERDDDLSAWWVIAPKWKLTIALAVACVSAVNVFLWASTWSEIWIALAASWLIAALLALPGPFRFWRFKRRSRFEVSGWEYLVSGNSLDISNIEHWRLLRIQIVAEPSAQRAAQAALILFARRANRRFHPWLTIENTPERLHWVPRGLELCGSANRSVIWDLYKFLSRDLARLDRRVGRINSVRLDVSDCFHEVEIEFLHPRGDDGG